MAESRIEITNLSLRFRFSFDKTWSIREKAAEVGRRILKKQKPRYFTALSGINLTVNQGEVLGIIGPNGCGKTTLLRTIAGIYSPDEGKIRVSGKVSTLLALGTGFDNRLSGLDNIRLNGLMMGLDKEAIEKLIPQITGFAEIGEHIDVPMKYYSSGMISRLSFAMILAMEPDILLIDEIFSVGDLAFQKKAENAMEQLLKKASCQVIVTHDLNLVREHCSRAVCMEGGKIIMDGSPREVIADYQKRMQK